MPEMPADVDPAAQTPAVNRSAASAALPQSGCLLGVDYGQARVGLALCDREQTLASPLEQIPRKLPEAEAAAWQRVVAIYGVVGIVIGLPLHMNGDVSNQARLVQTYANWLAKVTGLPVDYQDERCTTAAAEEMLWAAGLTHKQRKQRRDKLAAQLILQTYLDNRRNIA